MGLIEIASAKSVWRAIDYVEREKVVCWTKHKDTYDGLVEGSNDDTYKVYVDTVHPRKSTCTCPFAQEHRVICKHMLAIYFSGEPKVLENFLQEVEDYEEQERQNAAKHESDLYKATGMMSREELRSELVSAWLELEDYRSQRW